MRNALPVRGPLKFESGIINLDDKDGPGTHWVAYKKHINTITYFDSFGDLRPPVDLLEYFGGVGSVEYNHERYQDYDTFECGHLCLKFLTNQLNSPHKYKLFKLTTLQN